MKHKHLIVGLLLMVAMALGACGTSSLAGFFNFQSPRIKVNNSLNASACYRVLVGIQEDTLLDKSG